MLHHAIKSMKISKITLILSLLSLSLVGCAVPPRNPVGAAPVVDQSVYLTPQTPVAAMPPKPAVQVTPLEQPAAIVPERRQQPAPKPRRKPKPKPKPEPVVADTPAPKPKPKPKPAPEPAGNKAVVALLDSAADAVGSGNLDKAASSLERALRIEPRNASIWHDLGQIRLHQRKFNQARSMAEKSNGLAGGNKALKARNWRLIAVAKRAAGDNAGADAADAKATVLER